MALTAEEDKLISDIIDLRNIGLMFSDGNKSGKLDCISSFSGKFNSDYVFTPCGTKYTGKSVIITGLDSLKRVVNSNFIYITELGFCHSF